MMNPHGLLAILEKEKEIYGFEQNNEEEVAEIIKAQTSFNHIFKNMEPLLVTFYSLFSLSLSVIIAKPIISFIDPHRENILIGLTIFSLILFSSIFCGGILLKTIYKFLFDNKKDKQKIITTILEERFLNNTISNEVLSYLKIILTDDEYFELMKDKKDITNKEAFNIAKLKIHKEDILMDKKNLVLDLKKLKEYKIQVNS